MMMKNRILLLLLFVSTIIISKAQQANFRKYSTEQGICNNQIYDIKQDKNGFIWLGTGEGLCSYDGFEFSAINTDSIEQSAVSAMFVDKNRDLWVGFQNGNVLKYNGVDFENIIKGSEIGNSKIVEIIERENDILIVSQNKGLALVSSKNEKQFIENDLFADYYLTSFETVSSNMALVGTFDGLLLFNINDIQNIEVLDVIAELEWKKVQDIAKFRNEGYLVATEGEGLYLVSDLEDSVKVELVTDFQGMEYLNVQSIFTDKKGDVWLSSFGEGVLRLGKGEGDSRFSGMVRYNTKNGLGADNTMNVYEDNEGSFWIGTFSNGLACLSNEAFKFNEFENLPIGKNITDVVSNESTVWYASGSSVLQVDRSNESKPVLLSQGLPNDKITALHVNDNNLWVGTEKKGLYKKSGNGFVKVNVAANSLALSINNITGTNDLLWVSTKDGVFLLKNGEEPKHFSTNTGLAHNDINEVYLDDDNNAWVATKSKGLMYFTPELQSSFFYSENLQEMEFVSIRKDKNNNVWAAVKGFGVIMFGQDTIMGFNVKAGLKSNYCYSLEIDKNDNVWVGHRNGISKINIESYNVKSYSTKEGISGDCNQNALMVNSNDELVFGTTNGIVIYNPDKDTKEKVMPLTNFVSIRVSYGETDLSFKPGEDIVLPYNKYRMRFDFIGLSYKSPESITYQYRLEGYDEWSDLSDIRYASYGKIADGNYTFQVKACNEDRVCSEEPLSINIKVRKPYWKTLWFMAIVAIILIMAVVIIIKIRERKQKELQEYLQRNLDERTREVVKQKEEIEVKNRDITDSINYAQRIQASILPSIKTLQTHFSGSFVFYQPRDIVSGDFYWFGLTKNDKFIIVCADSTGHGVPGAFMSMIGTILIKDICARKEVVKPSDILSRLDEELSNTLNQNIEAERSNDGMDIIVCEIDIKTHYARIASAMRPIIVYQNGQQIYVKGSRNSVGGHIQKEEKVFENEGFQLAKGDLVYMFSDGYPDQFGGPMEKKFKMVRLKNLLKDIHQKPMDEQFKQVKNTFNVWKEGLEQIDDVLFMGIKI